MRQMVKPLPPFPIQPGLNLLQEVHCPRQSVWLAISKAAPDGSLFSRRPLRVPVRRVASRCREFLASGEAFFL